MLWEERFQTWCICRDGGGFFFFLLMFALEKKGEFTRLREDMAEGEDERLIVS